jgi:hypothetical protein
MRVQAALLPFLLPLLFACPTPIEPVDAGASSSDAGTLICEDSDDCGERAICQGGACVDVGDGCVSRTECPTGQACVGGVCGDPPETCSSSEECLAPAICDGFSQRCVDPNATGCVDAADCAFEPGCGGGCTCEPNGSCEPVAAVDAGPGVDAGAPGPDAGTTPPPSGGDVDLSGFVLENREHDPPIHVTVLPDGVVLSPGEVLVLARNSDEAAFESFWGVTLPATAEFLNAGVESSGVPIVNGDESWALLTPLGSLVDGPTAIGQSNRCFFRDSAGDASNPASWVWDNTNGAMPGGTLLPTTGVGLVISQWCDATGGGNTSYEFLQLYYAP